MKTMTTTTQPQGEASSPDFELRIDGSACLMLMRDGEAIAVRPVPCFPWSEPGGMVSLRSTADGEEVAFLQDNQRLNGPSQEALWKALREARFTFAVRRILAVRDELELRVWEVETEQGFRKFQTKLDDWPRPVQGGASVIRDLAGDLYTVRDPESLDARSRRLFWAFNG